VLLRGPEQIKNSDRYRAFWRDYSFSISGGLMAVSRRSSSAWVGLRNLNITPLPVPAPYCHLEIGVNGHEIKLT
jgi:hypothetical protein